MHVIPADPLDVWELIQKYAMLGALLEGKIQAHRVATRGTESYTPDADYERIAADANAIEGRILEILGLNRNTADRLAPRPATGGRVTPRHDILHAGRPQLVPLGEPRVLVSASDLLAATSRMIAMLAAESTKLLEASTSAPIGSDQTATASVRTRPEG